MLFRAMGVYYALTGHPFYYELALLSIESLRYYSPSIHIDIIYFGPMSRHYRNRFLKLKVNLVKRPPVVACLYTSVKWLALPFVSASKRVLFLDADTILYGPVEKLLSSHCAKSFYAREEIATRYSEARGTYKIPKRIRSKSLNFLRKSIRSRKCLIFNTSVMIMEQSFRKCFSASLPLYIQLMHDFYKGETQYPGTSLDFSEEVAASLVIGTIKSCRYGTLRGGHIEHYNRWVVDISHYKTAMHIGSSHMLQFLGQIGDYKTKKNLINMIKQTSTPLKRFTLCVNGDRISMKRWLQQN